MWLLGKQPVGPRRRDRLAAQLKLDDRAQQHEGRLRVEFAARALEQAARQRILARARREHGLQMIETRIARHDRRRMAQRRQHVAIAAEIAERRGDWKSTLLN